MSDHRPPTCSVVLCTFNRACQISGAVEHVLGQAGVDLQLVVVDDGSTDDTPARLAGIDDARLRVVRRSNGGLANARNTGIEASDGRWVVVLDDDDRPEDGWLAALCANVDDVSVGITSCGGTFVDPAGRETGTVEPEELGPLFGGLTAAFLPGLFAVRRSVLDAAGGFLADLGFSQQYELAMRIGVIAAELGLRGAVDDRRLLRIARRHPTDRPIVNPSTIFDANRWVLARHAVRYRLDRPRWSSMRGTVGVSAFRLGRPDDARRHLRDAVRAQPTNPRHWGRLALSQVSPIAKRVWGTAADFAAHDPDMRGLPLQHHSGTELFLPWRYVENANRSSDAEGSPYWDVPEGTNDTRYQDPVYRIAAKLVSRERGTPVLDVGCGSGRKLVERIGPVTDDFVGVDQPSAIATAERTYPGRRWVAADLGDDTAWSGLAELRPRLVLCADVIEHLDDPAGLLRRLRDLGTQHQILLSTPDRPRLDGSSPTGPPANPRHIREWSSFEMELLLESTGLGIARRWHVLPRRYSATRSELNRAVYRALHARAVPDPRSCMVFLLRPR